MANECECNFAIRQRTAHDEMIVAMNQDADSFMPSSFMH